VSRGGVALGLARRGTKAWITSPPFVAITLLFPLVFLIALAGGLAPLYEVPDFDYAPGYTAFVYGFVVLQAAAFGGIFTGYAVARDFSLGVAPRLFLATTGRGELLLGYVLVAVIRSLIAAAAVTLAALIGGMDVSVSVGGAAELGLLVIAVAVAAALWCCGVALRARSLRSGPLMHTPILLIMFLTPVYVPAALLGGWLRDAAAANPFSDVVEASRSILAGGSDQVAAALALFAAVIALLCVWTLRGLRQAERELAPR